MKDNQVMNIAANNIRILVASMVEKAKSGHPGGAMGGADFINVLYSEFLNYSPSHPDYPFRDRFFLDPGHMSPMLYSVLTMAGFYTLDDLKNFRQWGSNTPGHPEVDHLRGVENTSGPLGQGHTMALGAAIAERFFAARFGEWCSHKTYAFISDGGIQEEISQGTGQMAGHLGMSNLIMYYDSNDIQLSTKVSVVSSEDVAAKYRAWNWNVVTINGQDVDAIREALLQAINEKERPSLIIGKTIMGKGALDSQGQSFEKMLSTHGQPLSAAGADIPATIKNLGGDPSNPFVIFPEVKEMYAKRKAQLEDWYSKTKSVENKWRDNNPEEAKKMDRFFSGQLPEIDYNSIAIKEGGPTRGTSGTMLGVFSEKIENMIVASADLCNSDKTEGFLKHTTIIKKGDFSGRFLQMGVSELTMACVMNGIALHGGIIPACGTFFVFSDYMKPAIRMAALMHIHVIYVWSHDSFRVGEDGPTHQPIEHETQLRLLENVRNKSGERSILILRPSDNAETVAAWKAAIEEKKPVGLILSRQNVQELPAKSGNRREEAIQLNKGGYIVSDCEGKPDVILIANGSDVTTLVEGAVLLSNDGIKTRIVALPSQGLFFDQPKEYRESILPKDVVRYGLTSGLSMGLEKIVGENGFIHGLDHFGFSAPFKVLEQKFGYTAQVVHEEVKQLLNK